MLLVILGLLCFGVMAVAFAMNPNRYGQVGFVFGLLALVLTVLRALGVGFG